MYGSVNPLRVKIWTSPARGAALPIPRQVDRPLGLRIPIHFSAIASASGVTNIF